MYSINSLQSDRPFKCNNRFTPSSGSPYKLINPDPGFSHVSALRLMFFTSNRSHAIPYVFSANILPLKMLYFETVFSLMHDISTNSAPGNIYHLFT